MTDWILPDKLTESAFSEIYRFPDFRVSCSVYQPRTSFSGLTRAGLVVSLGGEFEFRFEEKVHVIGHNQHALLPKGGFDFRVVGDDEAKVLLVWNLRELMKAK